MALQFVFGSAGSGKSYTIYQKLIQESIQNPRKKYLVLVPDQYTMQITNELVQMHPAKGLLNVDVLSFKRMAFRIFQEVGGVKQPLLEETGKSLVVQRVAQEKKKKLQFLGGQMKKQGYVHEVKSMISELMQYEVEPQDLEKLQNIAEKKPLLAGKIGDLQILYKGYKDFLSQRFMTGEEMLDAAAVRVPESKKMAGTTVILDGFTGFTPVQHRLLLELMKICPKVVVLLTLDEREDPYHCSGTHRLFALTQQTVETLCKLAKEAGTEVLDEIRVISGENSRFAQAPELAFLEQNIFRFRKKKWSGEPKCIHLYAAGNPMEEMRKVAGTICKLVREEGYRYRDIAVITADPESYKTWISRAFEECGIPYFLDEKHTVLLNPFVEYIRAAVDLAVQDFRYPAVFRFLRTGLTGIPEEEIDLLENYVIALGIQGRKRWQEKWVRVVRGVEDEKLLQINEIRLKVLGLIEDFVCKIRGKGNTVLDDTRYLRELIEAGNLEQLLAERAASFSVGRDAALAKEYEQIYGIIGELFEKLEDILGEEKLRLGEYQQLLEAGLLEAQVGIIPPTIDQVMVGDMERSRLGKIKALFFAGMNEGLIPRKNRTGGLLSDTDREFLKDGPVGLAPTAKEQLYTQRFYLYLSLTKPERQLYLSYSQSTGAGEGQMPSYLVGTIQMLFPDMRTEVLGEGYETEPQYPAAGMDLFLQGLRQAVLEEPDLPWKELFAWYLKDSEYRSLVEKMRDAAFYENPMDHIGKQVAQALYGKILVNSATRLERFAACAYAHFLQYGLRLIERQVYEFRSMDMGNVMHKCLEQFSRILKKEGLSWRHLDEEQRNMLAERCVDEIIHDYGNTILHSTARMEYQIERIKRLMRRTVWALQEQIRYGDFEPEVFEMTFSIEEDLNAVNFQLAPEEKMCLRGIIDRVDICEEDDKVLVKVVDYKTNNQSLDLVALYHGLQLQLIVYMNAALEIEERRHPGKSVEPAAIFYYQIKDPMEMQEDDEDLKRKILTDLKVNGLIQESNAIIQKMDRYLTEGVASSPVIPAGYTKKGTFTKYSSVASKEKFQQLSEFADYKIRELGERILKGEAQISPYQLKQKQACANCTFKEICGYDEKIPGFSKRVLKQFSDEEIWKYLKKEE